MISSEQFIAEHPEHAESDDTTLTKARIAHEHKERVTLEEQRQVLLKKKQALIAGNQKRKDDLANLDKDLEKFIDVCCLPTVIRILLILLNRLQNPFRRPSRKLSEARIYIGS